MSDYRAERRADRAADAELKLKAKIESERLRAEERRKDAEAEDKRRRSQDSAAAKERAAKKEAARARRSALVAKAMSEAATLFVSSVMGAALVASYSSQLGYFRDHGANTLEATLGAFAIEAATWAFTALAARAERDHRPTGALRAGAFALAAFAGVLNFLHWGGVLGVAFGVLAPLAAILWDRRTHPSTRTREDRVKARRTRRRTKDRESAHKAVAGIARSLVLADFDGVLTASEAWRRAWRVEHGTDVLGMTPALRARSVDSARRFRDAGEEGDGFSPEALAVDALLSDLFPEGEGGGSQRPSDGPAKKRGPLGGIGLSRPGRTARKDDVEPLAAADLDAARKLYDAAPARFSTPAVAKLLGRSNQYAKRIRDAVKDERESH
ncbi:hypothetical protein ACFQ71_31700 [Streptomyces sp. NPDC056534]|uniref:hypothetical protein n=1 Tax=Streptomyces sp. NPDC056534 TaxID=3345857 RepID=UPI003677085A